MDHGSGGLGLVGHGRRLGCSLDRTVVLDRRLGLDASPDHDPHWRHLRSEIRVAKSPIGDLAPHAFVRPILLGLVACTGARRIERASGPRNRPSGQGQGSWGRKHLDAAIARSDLRMLLHRVLALNYPTARPR